MLCDWDRSEKYSISFTRRFSLSPSPPNITLEIVFGGEHHVLQGVVDEGAGLDGGRIESQLSGRDQRFLSALEDKCQGEQEVG